VSLRDFSNPKSRRTYLEKETGCDLSPIANVSYESDKNVHCENLIGVGSIPMGVAGPLAFDHGKKVFFPLATTEGALVASISRGCKAISESGGVVARSSYHGQMRGPVFEIDSIDEGLKLKKWIEENKALLQETAAMTSSHISYKSAKVKIIGSNVFVRFTYDTDKAMGMNMVTIATEALVSLIELNTKSRCVAVAGNFDIDKKPAWLNSIDGRGYEVWAEAVISKSVLDTVLHTTAIQVYKTWLAKCMLGSYASGSLGYNSHFANIIAAIFIATGQDPAHVVEGSSGITICEVRRDDLCISVNIPSLQVGTIGGGTNLPTQKAAMTLMGIDGNVLPGTFAEYIGGAVLSGELSLIASLSTRSLGSAHKTLGRNKA